MDTNDTLLIKIVGFEFLILEWFILIFNKNVGEEIIVTAIKNWALEFKFCLLVI